MSNKIVILLVIAAVVCINAKPEPEANFPDFSTLFKPPPGLPNFFGNFPSLPVAPVPVASPDAIKNLRGIKDGHVSGSYHSSSSSFKSVNGVPVEDKHNDRDIVNVDGHVQDRQY